MAVDVTIDHVIRRQLAMKGLSLHYYLPMLLFARRGLDEIQFNSLGKVSMAVLPIGSNFEATLPSDFVECVEIVMELGDKMKPMGVNERINPRDNSHNAFSIYPDQAAAFTYGNYPQWSPSVYTEYGAYKGRLFGANTQFYNSYQINRDLGIIRFDNKIAVTSVLLIYLTKPQKNITNQSVIHPFAQNALIEYMNWKWDEYTKNPDYPNRRKEFYNQYRILRAMLNKMTTTEIMRSLRKNTRMTIKN